MMKSISLAEDDWENLLIKLGSALENENSLFWINTISIIENDIRTQLNGE